MVRRVTQAQLNAALRQAQQKQKQAIDQYNAKVRQHNRERQRAVDKYNREAQAHNSRVRSNRQRLQREIAKLAQRSTTTTRHTITQTSTRRLHTAFSYVDAAANAGTWSQRGAGLVDLAEGEAANSARVVNGLLGEHDAADDAARLEDTALTDELMVISADLDQRWRGALFALDARNPDAARHFCTSSREVLTRMIDLEAPDSEVLKAMPDCLRATNGLPARRAKITYLLRRSGVDHAILGDFVEEDINDVLGLFGVFNTGTHGSAGTFGLPQLALLKDRVEGAIRFISAVVRAG